MKKITSLMLGFVLAVGLLPVWASGNNDVDWQSLYAEKMEEIKAEYESGVRDDEGMLSFYTNGCYFSVQDINFDGVPELYHAVCSTFELDPEVVCNEEIYYIKDGKVLKGTIEQPDSFCLLPMHAGGKADPGDVNANRWQFAMRDQATGEICFITHDSYSGGADYPDVDYSKLIFDSTTGVLKSEILLHQEFGSYTVELKLRGYDYVSADCYTVYSDTYGWGISHWKPGYLAPKVVVNGEAVEFDAPAVIIEGRTLVPIRRIADALDMQVTWDEAKNQVGLSKNGTTVVMTIDESKYYLNGQEKTMDTCAQIMSDRTFVPVRFVSEALGCSVKWDEDSWTVTISE